MMPVFAAEFGYTPAEFRALSLLDFNRLTRWLERRNTAQQGESQTPQRRRAVPIEGRR